jgi:hypothetical protein
MAGGMRIRKNVQITKSRCRVIRAKSNVSPWRIYGDNYMLLRTGLTGMPTYGRELTEGLRKTDLYQAANIKGGSHAR